MKTITTILIMLLISALALFLGAAGKAFAGPDGTPAAEDPPIMPEEPVEDETAILPEDDPGQPEEEDPGAISSIEVYLDGPRDEGILLGEAQYGLTSRQAYSIYGEELSQSGFLLALEDSGLEFEPGSIHHLYIYTLIPEYGWEYTRHRVAVDGEAGLSQSIELHIDGPGHDALIQEEDMDSLRISGWSADVSLGDRTGIEKVEVYLNGPRDMGSHLGQADYGLERQDVAAALGNSNYVNSGYSLVFDATGLGPGTENTLYVYSYSAEGTYNLAMRDFLIEGEREDPHAIMSVEASLEGNSVNISGWAVSRDEAASAGPRATDIEYADKKIAFVSSQNGNEDIYIMNIDGSGLSQLTDSPQKDAYPAGSPDGSRIAYTAEIGGYWQVVVMDIDGSNKVQLTDDPFRSGYPTWSFDGRYIFYEAYKDGDWEIYRMASDGSDKKRLTFNSGEEDWHPFAHPYQYKVIFESGVGGREKIYIMDHDGSNIERLSDSDARMRVPSMSVDGRYIAFMGYQGDTRYVYMMDGDGENIRLISQRANSEHPFISPDNELIAFNSYVDGQSEIFVINMDGSGETRLTSLPGDDWGPAFIYQLP